MAHSALIALTKNCGRKRYFYDDVPTKRTEQLGCSGGNHDVDVDEEVGYDLTNSLAASDVEHSNNGQEPKKVYNMLLKVAYTFHNSTRGQVMHNAVYKEYMTNSTQNSIISWKWVSQFKYLYIVLSETDQVLAP